MEKLCVGESMFSFYQLVQLLLDVKMLSAKFWLLDHHPLSVFSVGGLEQLEQIFLSSKKSKNILAYAFKAQFSY